MRSEFLGRGEFGPDEKARIACFFVDDKVVPGVFKGNDFLADCVAGLEERFGPRSEVHKQALPEVYS